MMFPSSGFLFFAALLSSESVNARPITSRRDDGVIHLPLKRLHNLERTDIRPHVVCDSFPFDLPDAQYVAVALPTTRQSVHC